MIEYDLGWVEEAEIEKLKTWLLNVKATGEIILGALVHIGLVEVLGVLISR